MNYLLNHGFAPITFEMGFLETSIEAAVDGYVSWQSGILEKYGSSLDKKEVSAPIQSALESLLPLTSPIRRRFLFSATQSGWVAFFDNGCRGTDAAAPMQYLAGRLRCRGMRVVVTPHTMPRVVTKDSKGTYGATILEIYGADGEFRRTVYAANDGGPWKFGQSGEPLPFENPESYKARKIRDRFTPEMLDVYLRAMGLRVFDEAFYMPPGSEAILISRQGDLPPDYREYELEDIQRDAGILVAKR